MPSSICHDHSAIGKESGGIDASRRRRQHYQRAVVSRDDDGAINGSTDDVAPSNGECYCIDGRTVPDRA